ncbi:unnamed protein product [Brassica oleracea]
MYREARGPNKPPDRRTNHHRLAKTTFLKRLWVVTLEMRLSERRGERHRKGALSRQPPKRQCEFARKAQRERERERKKLNEISILFAWIVRHQG